MTLEEVATPTCGLPGILACASRQTISSSVKSGCSSISASKKSVCFSNGDVLPGARGLRAASSRPIGRNPSDLLNSG